MKRAPALKLYWPHRTLGCLGLAIGSVAYIDFFVRPGPGIYARIGHRRYWLNLRTLRLKRGR